MKTWLNGYSKVTLVLLSEGRALYWSLCLVLSSYQDQLFTHWKFALTYTANRYEHTRGTKEWTLMADGNELIQIKDDPRTTAEALWQHRNWRGADNSWSLLYVWISFGRGSAWTFCVSELPRHERHPVTQWWLTSCQLLKQFQNFVGNAFNICKV